MNILSAAKRRVLSRALSAGLSIRAAARAAGISKVTAKKYEREWYAECHPRRCECGRLVAGHPAWCRSRVLRSPARREFLRRWGCKPPQSAPPETPPKTAPLSNGSGLGYWPSRGQKAATPRPLLPEPPIISPHHRCACGFHTAPGRDVCLLCEMRAA